MPPKEIPPFALVTPCAPAGAVHARLVHIDPFNPTPPLDQVSNPLMFTVSVPTKDPLVMVSVDMGTGLPVEKFTVPPDSVTGPKLVTGALKFSSPPTICV